MFSQGLGIFVPKARWTARNRWTSGPWAQFFWKDFPKNPGNELFSEGVFFDPTCGSQFFFVASGFQKHFELCLWRLEL